VPVERHGLGRGHRERELVQASAVVADEHDARRLELIELPAEAVTPTGRYGELDDPAVARLNQQVMSREALCAGFDEACI